MQYIFIAFKQLINKNSIIVTMSTDLTVKDIIVDIDNDKFQNPGGRRKTKKNWISISNKGLIYLSWDDGRIYFFPAGIDDFIRDLKKDDGDNKITFIYYGEWDNAGNILFQEKKVVVTFLKNNEYKKFIKNAEINFQFAKY